MLNRSRFAVAKISAGVAVALCSHVAFAADEESSKGLEVIEVTAQKRVENVQEVPIAISAFSEEAIRTIGLTEVNDLGLFTAGLETNNATATQTSFNIRGITTNDFGIGLDPAVAVYIDGVYIGRRGASNLNFNDVERVEVLKGPQGTLFGRNSAAGAIHIITKRAHEEFEGNVRVTLGNLGKVKFESIINAPIADNLFFKGTYINNRRDGFVERVDGGDDLGNQKDWSATGQFVYLPSTDLEAIFRFDISKLDQDSRPSATLNPGYGSGDPFGPVTIDADPREMRDVFGLSLEVNYDLGDTVFTSITSYREFQRLNRMEDDGSDFDRAFFESTLDEDQKQWSQEFRFTGQYEQLKWTAGATYFYEDIAQTTSINFMSQTLDGFALVRSGLNPALIPNIPAGTGMAGFYANLFPQLIGQLAQATGLSPEQVAGQIALNNYGKPHHESTDNRSKTTSYALYADATYEVTDKLDLTVGMRYTYDKKDFSIFTAYQNVIEVGFGIPDIPFGLAFATPQDIDQNDNWGKLTPRVVLDYQWNDQVMTYVSYSQGFKSGGFNTLGEAPPVKEETVTNTELGLKSTWLDNQLRINASLYQYDYENLQQLEQDGPAGGIPTYNLRNVDAEGKGFEIEVQWQAMDDLVIAANYSHLDTEYTKWGFFPWEEDELAAGLAVENRVGEPISGMPSDSGYLAADYFYDLANGTLMFHVDATYVSERSQVVDTDSLPVLPYDPATVQGLTADNKIDGYTLLNARIRYQMDEWEVALFGTNLANEKYLLDVGGQANAVGAIIAMPAQPRQYGVEFLYRF